VNIELDHHWTIVEKDGSTFLETYVEEGEKEWIHVLLRTPERGRWEGTKFHNRATVVIKNGEYEEAVSAVISVGDPRGGFCMESSVNQTGHYLSVPTDQESLPHVDVMEKRGEGFYKLTHMPVKKADEEE